MHKALSSKAGGTCAGNEALPLPAAFVRQFLPGLGRRRETMPAHSVARPAAVPCRISPV